MKGFLFDDVHILTLFTRFNT